MRLWNICIVEKRTHLYTLYTFDNNNFPFLWSLHLPLVFGCCVSLLLVTIVTLLYHTTPNPPNAYFVTTINPWSLQLLALPLVTIALPLVNAGLGMLAEKAKYITRVEVVVSHPVFVPLSAATHPKIYLLFTVVQFTNYLSSKVRIYITNSMLLISKSRRFL